MYAAALYYSILCGDDRVIVRQRSGMICRIVITIIFICRVYLIIMILHIAPLLFNMTYMAILRQE